jgi:glucose-6-phosphate dehydrogenase assembly protein OpcA
MAGQSDLVWSALDTTPGAIEAALRKLLVDFAQKNPNYVPERAINLVCVVDKRYGGEVANRLQGVGRYHASRTIVCAVEHGRREIDAIATIAAGGDPEAGGFSTLRESIILSVGEEHLDGLHAIVDPLVVTDLATVLWSPHGHPEAVDSLLTLAQVVLLDSLDEPDPDDALARVCSLADRAYIVDLAWLRSTPWRERIAAAFDAPANRGELARISSVKVSFRHGSEVAGLLLAGWLASRLGWRTSSLTRRGDVLRGRARGRRGEVDITLAAGTDISVPGLSGIEIETAEGTRLKLDRGTGGLTAHRRRRDGSEAEYTVLGASRGEPGILGEGIRQALLRDPTYRPALDAALELV